MREPFSSLKVSKRAKYAFCNPEGYPSELDFWETRLAVLEYIAGDFSKMMEYGPQNVTEALSEARDKLGIVRREEAARAVRMEHSERSELDRLKASRDAEWVKACRLAYDVGYEIESDRETCVYCDTKLRADLGEDKRTLDHIPPLKEVRAGRAKPGRCEIACMQCNQTLGVFPSELFEERLQRLLVLYRQRDRDRHQVDRIERIERKIHNLRA